MSDANLGHLLDDDAPLQLPTSWPLRRWAPIARDRIGDIGAVTRLQRANAKGFFADTTVYVRRDAGWEAEFENGHQWPASPTSPRPDAGRPIAMLTHVSGAAVGPTLTNVAFTAGVATTAVAGLRVTSAIEEHDVHVDQRTGAFVVLTLHPPDATKFRLTALDDSAHEIDRIDYQDPWSVGD
jgi:hypothetical protein